MHHVVCSGVPEHSEFKLEIFTAKNIKERHEILY